MKNVSFLTIFLTLLILLFAAQWTHAAACLRGDTNADGRITIGDYYAWQGSYYTQSIFVAGASPANSHCTYGDANADGEVSLKDFAIWHALRGGGTNREQGTVETATTIPEQPKQEPSDDESIGRVFGFSSSAVNQLDRMVAMNSKAVRTEMTWYSHEPNAPTNGKHTYRFLRDTEVLEANKRNLKVLAIADYTPQWAADPGCFATYKHWCGPRIEFAADYGAYVGALVERYDGDGIDDAPGSPIVDAWEIWNEPNLANFWRPQPQPTVYTAYLKAAYKAAKQADPNSTIVTGGLCCHMLGDNAPIPYLKALYAAGAKGHFDAVGMHPYTYPAMPSRVDRNNVWQQMSVAFPQQGQPDSIRSIMIANGDGDKKIWQTEMGAPTGGDTNGDGVSRCDNGDGVTTGNEDRCVTKEQQKQMLTEAFSLWQTYDWAGPFFWYSFNDASSGHLESEHNYGVLHSDQSPKPAALIIPTIAAQ